jgi:taurine dioxygenase
MASQPDFTQFEVRPLTGTIGAEVSGVDLARDRRPEVVAELKRAVHRYHVLAVRGQSLQLADFHALRESLGPFSGNPVHEPIPGYDDIMILNREPDESGKVIGEDWHMDLAWLQKPPGITMLYGEVVPPVGGDTCFTSLEWAYRSLSPGMKAMIADFVAVHSGRGVLGQQYGSVKMRADAAKIANFEVEHPLVCVDPVTGNPYLFLSSVIDHFKGLTPAESRPIVDYLIGVATRPEFNCRLRWQKGTLGMWLNPCVMHTAINDYPGQRRTMYRSTIEGWVPVASSGPPNRPRSHAA